LFPGAFDGFPTGASIEAGLCGVPVFCTDILNQNIAFKDGEEIVIINRDVEEICDRISHYRLHYDELIELGRRGRQAFHRELGLTLQMKKRFEILDALLLA
ncbi:MAG TPA: glycosyltransferase, partial [Pyrinomonadaceae bacterium]|nr:glycosyltransferase [Pyrinomonadaceae bacterium]